MGFRRVPGDPAELFALALGSAVGGHPGGAETEFPALDVYETPQEVVIEAELPGVDPARVEITALEGAILIEGVKDEALEPGRVNFLCMERSFGAFRRSVPLDRAADLTRVTATCRAGILQIRVPKLEEKRGRRRTIPVTPEPPDERSEP